jgi:ribosomal protein S18 acetylase RimI-like enzyme
MFQDQDQQQGVVKKQALTEADQAAIQQLADICNRYEDLHMRFTFTSAWSSGQHPHHFLYYERGTPAGYLYLYDFDPIEPEVTGMVHPDYRRRGIFRALLDAAKAEAFQRGAQQFTLFCEHASRSGQAFIAATGARYDFSEHAMILEQFQERPTFDERLVFRAASSAELDVLAAIQAASFGDSEEQVKMNIARRLQDPHQHYYVTTFSEESVGCEEPVGLVRVSEGPEEVGIYSFGVVTDYRRRGYGRQMLEEAIRTIRAESQKPIMLDVDITNAGALALYRSCGFQIRTTYDYYVLE